MKFLLREFSRFGAAGEGAIFEGKTRVEQLGWRGRPSILGEKQGWGVWERSKTFESLQKLTKVWVKVTKVGAQSWKRSAWCWKLLEGFCRAGKVGSGRMVSGSLGKFEGESGKSNVTIQRVKVFDGLGPLLRGQRWRVLGDKGRGHGEVFFC